ncbi:MAG: glycosyltransferase [Desulfobulbaceae bacterium]|nr:MAG: glycosyltransferase [Desulfobulbaceae bacterium]
MLKRFGRREGLVSAIGPAVFYLALALTIGISLWPYFYFVKNETLITIGLFATWRYSWQVTHYCRALVYRFIVYRRLAGRVQEAARKGIFPEHLFFIIPSYNEEPWVSSETFFSIMSELSSIPSRATLVVSTGSEQDDAVISAAYEAHPARHKVELVLQRQRRGKRIAMGHALRAVARRYNDKGLDADSSVTVFMDGDSYLEPGLLAKTLPLFCLDTRLGAVTTNELAYINTRSQWYKDWFNLKFGQRHILFQSHSLSRKVLTLTGRFSIFRSSIVVREDCITMIENDILTHPLHGRFRFLMGDDKSSWFYLLKEGWDMLYIPDAICYSLESRDARFIELSTSLPYRWYGNTLRNNGRALALGWRKTSLFIWICILDQRISMWTSLVGIAGATILALFKNFIYLPIFIAWILIVRTIQMLTIAFNGHPVSLLTIPIMLYNQWVGSIIKIRAFFHLADQKWSKGGRKQDASADSIPIPHALARFLPRTLMGLSYTAFFFALLVTEQVLNLPDVHALQAAVNVRKDAEPDVLIAREHGVVPDDGRDDGAAINRLITGAADGTVIRLPSGRLDIAVPIVISRSHITLQGQGRESTVLASAMMTSAEAVVAVTGDFGKKLGKLTTALDAGSSVMEMPLTGEVRPGDILLLRQANDDAFLDSIGSRRWRRELPIIRQSMVQIQEIRNNQLLFFDHAPDIEYAAGKTQVIRPELIRDVTIRDLTLVQEIPGQRIEEVRHRYENLFPDYQLDLLRLIWTAFCRVENVGLHAAGRHPLVFENSFGNSAAGLDIRGAWNKGASGSGYLRLARAFRSKVSDSEVRDIRHITIQWSSAYNILENIYSEVDINLHGGYSHHNLVREIRFAIPPEHKWSEITETPHDANWAPPDGPGNNIILRQTAP